MFEVNYFVQCVIRPLTVKNRVKTLLSERVVRHDMHLNGDKSINCQKVFLLIGIHNILPIWIFEK